MKVSEWIERHPGLVAVIHAEATLDELVDRILENHCLQDIYVVSPEGRIIGHLSAKRIFHLLLIEHRPAHTRRQLMERVARGNAQELMNHRVVHARPDEELDDVIHRQLEHELEDMPVLDAGGEQLGKVNIRKVLQEFRKTAA